jgi:hypothetical protein
MSKRSLTGFPRRAAVLAAAIGAAWAAPVAPAMADSCPNASLRTGLSAELPSCRAFEMVSESDDPAGNPAGIDTAFHPYPAIAATSDRVLYGGPGPIGETTNGAANPWMAARRTSDGWRSEVVQRSDDPDTVFELAGGEPYNMWANPDGTEVLFRSLPRMTEDARELEYLASPWVNYFRVDLLSGQPEWAMALEPGLSIVNNNNSDTDSIASEDVKTLVMSLFNPMTHEAATAGVRGIYAFRDGGVELVSRGPDGVPLGEPGLPASSGQTSHAHRNELSADGRYLLFTNREGPNLSTYTLFVRDLVENVTRQLVTFPDGVIDLSKGWAGGGDTTVSRYTLPDGLVTAAKRAPIAYFSSTGNLAGGASGTGPKIYRANLANGQLFHSPQVDGPPVGVSDYGNRILYLRPGATAADPWQLRFWDAELAGTSTLVGTLPAGVGPSAVKTHAVRATEGGRVWTFAATGALDPDRPAVNPANKQVYRWEVGDANPTCLSCAPVDGVSRNNGASIAIRESTYETLLSPTGSVSPNAVRQRATSLRARGLSTDGRRVFFDSPDRLVARDQNNMRDVYMWDGSLPEGQRLHLLTSGSTLATGPSYYLDSNPDGSDVFYATQDALVAADIDGTYDVYTARVGGGFADQSEPPECVGEACQGPPSPTPGPHAPASIGQQGPGNIRTLEVPASVAFRVVKARAVGRRVVVRARASADGRVRLTGRSVKARSVKLDRSTTAAISLKLKKKARRALSARGRVKVKLRLVFRAASGQRVTRTAKVTVKRAKLRNERKGR